MSWYLDALMCLAWLADLVPWASGIKDPLVRRHSEIQWRYHRRASACADAPCFPQRVPLSSTRCDGEYRRLPKSRCNGQRENLAAQQAASAARTQLERCVCIRHQVISANEWGMLPSADS